MLDLLSEVSTAFRSRSRTHINSPEVRRNCTITERLFHSRQRGSVSIKAGEDDRRLIAYAGGDPGRQQRPQIGVRNPIFLAAFSPKEFVPRPEVLRIFMTIPGFTFAYLPLRS